MIPYYNGSIIFIATNSDIQFGLWSKCTDILLIYNKNYTNNINDYIPKIEKMPHLNEGLRMLCESIIVERWKEIDDKIKELLKTNKHIIVRYSDMHRFIKDGCAFYC